MQYTLQFIVMIQSDNDLVTLLDKLLSTLPKATRNKVNSFLFKNNWIELWQNEDFDSKKIHEKERFLFYRYRLEATPLHEEVNEDSQVTTAQEICQSLKRIGADVVLCANFENRLPEFG